jgi:hypothetical protein
VPRGAPQWRHLIGVEEGASSVQSKTIPIASQLMQIKLKSGQVLNVCKVVIFAFSKTMPPSGVIAPRPRRCGPDAGQLSGIDIHSQRA